MRQGVDARRDALAWPGDVECRRATGTEPVAHAGHCGAIVVIIEDRDVECFAEIAGVLAGEAGALSLGRGIRAGDQDERSIGFCDIGSGSRGGFAAGRFA